MNTFVYVVDHDKNGMPRAHARTVSVGYSFGDEVSILEGLKPNEVVVADGSFKLHEGALLMDADAPPPAAPTADNKGSSSKAASEQASSHTASDAAKK